MNDTANSSNTSRSRKLRKRVVAAAAAALVVGVGLTAYVLLRPDDEPHQQHKAVERASATTSPQGTATLQFRELGHDVNVAVKDPDGGPIDGVSVRGVVSKGTLVVVASDPKGRYLPELCHVPVSAVQERTASAGLVSRAYAEPVTLTAGAVVIVGTTVAITMQPVIAEAGSAVSTWSAAQMDGLMQALAAMKTTPVPLDAPAAEVKRRITQGMKNPSIIVVGQENKRVRKLAQNALDEAIKEWQKQGAGRKCQVCEGLPGIVVANRPRLDNGANQAVSASREANTDEERPRGPHGARLGATGGVTAPSGAGVIAQRLGALPQTLRELAVSDDGCHFALTLGAAGGECVFVDGRTGPRYDDIYTPRFSPGGSRIAYVARKGRRWHVVVDGREGPAYDEIDIVDFPIFSPDGSRVAYAARKGQGWHIVVDDEEGPKYNHIYTLLFSPDGSRIAYGASKGDKSHVVVDGTESPPYDGLGVSLRLVFSADGSRIAYRAQRASEEFVVVDGEEGPGYWYIDSIVFSSDGRHVAYEARKRRGGLLVVVDGEERPGYAVVSSAAGSRIAYAAAKGHKEHVVVDGEPGPAYDDIDDRTLTFSPNGSIAYAARQGNKWHVVVDGEKGPAYDSIENRIVFSTDGEHVAYVARNATRECYYVVVDGRTGPRYDDIYTPRFSPGGSRIAYVARKGRRWHVVVDGREGPGYDYICYDYTFDNGLTFHSDGTLEYLAVTGDLRSFLRPRAVGEPRPSAVLYRVRHVPTSTGRPSVNSSGGSK